MNFFTNNNIMLLLALILAVIFSVSTKTYGTQQITTVQLRPQPLQVLKVQEGFGKSTITSMKEQFHVGSVFGNRDAYKLTIKQPGQLKLQAIWKGTAETLSLILNGPGQEGYYARKDGKGPLKIRFEVTPEQLKRGNEWKVSVVNFHGGSAVGTLDIEYPVRSWKLKELKPNDLKIFKIEGIVLGMPKSGTTKRKILEDGIIEIRYPDGTIKLFHPDGSFTIIHKDGTASRTLFVHVQPDTVPSLPSDLPDDDLNAWLDSHRQSLLDAIREILSNETSFNNYLKLEEGKTLYEKINLGIRCINNLLAPAP